MYGLAKFGYLLIGASIGVFGSSLILEHEFDKPVGEIEEYIPREDRDDTTENQDDSREDSSENRNANSKDQASRQKDISSGRNGRDGNPEGRGEGGSHSEFGSGQADLYNFYSSAEERFRPSGSGRNGRDGDSGEKVTSEKSDKGKMSEADKRRAEFEARRGDESVKRMTRYSKMYSNGEIQRTAESEGGDDMNDILHQVNSNTKRTESYNQEDGPDKIDEDYLLDDADPFEIDIHQTHKLEWIEGPFEIFLDDYPRCETIPLTYYAGDYTLCDDGDQIIPDPEDVVGMAALNRLIEGGPGVHNDVIFVHNTKTNLNYEVMLESFSYQETMAAEIDAKFSKE